MSAARLPLAVVLALSALTPGEARPQGRYIQCSAGESVVCTYEFGGGTCFEGHPRFGNCLCRCVETFRPEVERRVVPPTTPPARSLGIGEKPPPRDDSPADSFPRYTAPYPPRPAGSPAILDPRLPPK